MEENQRLASERWKQCGNDNYYLAILWNNNVYFISIYDINLEDKSLDLKKHKETWSGFYEK